MTENNQKINNTRIPPVIPKELAGLVSVKHRMLPNSQKQVIFEETILKEYRKRSLLKKIVIPFCGLAAVASAFVLWSVFMCGTQERNLYSHMMELPEGQGVTIVSDSGARSLSSGLANIEFCNGSIVLNGGDTIRASYFADYILVSDHNQSIVKLVDGTKIIMNSGSRLAVPADFNDRNVAFSGEAIFNVRHDERHPFNVDAGIAKTTVFGTEFLINTYPKETNHACVALFSGRLSVCLSSLDDEVMLNPSEMVSMIGQSYIKTSGIPEDMGQWKPVDVLELDESLDIILEKVSRYYDIDVNCNGNLKDVFCHGRIVLSDSPFDFFEVLSELAHVKYEFSNDNKIVTVSKN